MDLCTYFLKDCVQNVSGPDKNTHTNEHDNGVSLTQSNFTLLLFGMRQTSSDLNEKFKVEDLLPGVHVGGEATALLALILCENFMSSSDDIFFVLA